MIHHMELEEPAAMPCMIHIFFFFLLKMSTQCICHLSQFSIFVFLTYFQTLIFQEFEIQNIIEVVGITVFKGSLQHNAVVIRKW